MLRNRTEAEAARAGLEYGCRFSFDATISLGPQVDCTIYGWCCAPFVYRMKMTTGIFHYTDDQLRYVNDHYQPQNKEKIIISC